MAITKITTPELFNLQSNNTEGTQLPVMTRAERIAMTGMSNGELIFNSTTDSVEYYDAGAAAWYKIDYVEASYSSYQAWDVGNPASYPGTGNTLTNINGTGFNYVKAGGVSYDSTNKSFVFNASNGSNGAFMNFNQSTMNIPYSYSVSYWINLRVQNTGQYAQNLYCFGYSTTLRIQYFPNGNIDVWTPSTGYLGSFSTGMSIANWYNITHTFTSGNMKTYISLEGDTVATLKQNQNSSMPNPNSASTWFGSNVQNYNGNFDGQLRLIEFYDSTLSQTEIDAIVVRGSQP